MRTSQIRHSAVALPSFTGPKCKTAIPVRDVLLRYALQQASLEPLVRAIRDLKASYLQGPLVALAGAVIDRTDGNFLLSVSTTRPQRSDEDHARLAYALRANGLRLLERDATDIRREPLFSNARAVWSHERYDVPLKDRLKIAAALAEDGPRSILELEERARPTCDILAALCALACENLVELSIYDGPLSPHTIARGL